MLQGKIEPQDIDINSVPSERGESSMMGQARASVKNPREDSDVDDSVARAPKRMRPHRHSPHQIQEMDKLFKECPHPSDKQRRELASVLGLEPSQVKFWFQNKRNQMKTQHEQAENIMLRRAIEKYQEENQKYKDALLNACCASCGRPIQIGDMSAEEYRLKTENQILKREIQRITKMASNYLGKPITYP